MSLGLLEIAAIQLIMISSDEELDEVVEIQKTRKKRKCWVRDFYLERNKTGAQEVIVQRLKELNDPELHRWYFRMNMEQFEFLLNLVSPLIVKQTYIREPISPSVRLAITLRYLATGESQRSLSISYKCSTSSITKILYETTSAITLVLKKESFQKINSNNFKSIAKDFETKWNFPNCIGAIDGKHILIEAPPNSGSEFYNYKKSSSIVLLGICDANYNFTMCDIGAAGRQSDGGVFRNSTFGRRFYSDTLPIPIPRDVSNTFKSVPYVFVADDAFSLTTNMMKPYIGNNLTLAQRIFNYRLSRARRIIENTFGILSSKWRIFKSPIKGKLELVQNVVEACVCLHNSLRQSSETYITKNLVDHEIGGEVIPGSWRSEESGFIDMDSEARNPTNSAKKLRDNFSAHFIGSGAVDWQMDKI